MTLIESTQELDKYLKRKQFDALFRHAYKVGCKHYIVNLEHVISYYDKVHELTKQYIRQFACIRIHLTWLDHFLYSLNKMNNFVRIEEICKHYVVMDGIGFLEDKKISDAKLNMVALRALIDLYCGLAALKTRSNSWIEDLKSAVKNLLQFKDMLTKPSKRSFKLIYILWKTLECLRDYVKKNLKDEKDGLFANCLTLELDLMKIGMKWEQSEEIDLDTFSKLQEYYDETVRTLSLLKQTMPIRPKAAVSKTTKDYAIAVNYYNTGVKLFNEKKYEKAGDSVEKACKSFKKWFASLPEPSSSDKQKVAKCFGLLGRIQQNRRDYEKAIHAFVNAILFVDWTSDSDDKSLYVQHFVQCNSKLDREKQINLLDSLDKATFPKVIKGAILAEELQAYQELAENGVNTCNDQLSIIEQQLSIYPEETNPINRAIVLLEKERVVCSNQLTLENLQNAISVCDKCVELLQRKDSGEDKMLRPGSMNEIALTYVTKGIFQLHMNLITQEKQLPDLQKWKDWRFGKNPDPKKICEQVLKILTCPTTKTFNDFVRALRVWEAVLESCKKQPQYTSVYIRKSDITYQHLEMVSKILDYYGYTTLYIHCLMLMKYMNKYVRAVEYAEDEDETIKIQCDNMLCDIRLSRVCIDLGYTDKAQELLDGLENTIENLDPEEEEALYCKYYYKIIFGYLLTETGKLQDALDTFSETITYLEKQRRTYVIAELLSTCKYYIALVHLRKCNPSQAAIDEGMKCLKLRMSGLINSSVLEKANVLKAVDDSKNTEPDQSYNYHNMILSLLQIGNLYEARGSLNEAEHFLFQGLFVALCTLSPVYVIECLLAIGKMEKNRHRFTFSKQYLETVYKLWKAFEQSSKTFNSRDISRVQCVSSLVQLADLYRKMGHFKRARELIGEASECVEKFSAAFPIYSETEGIPRLDMIMANKCTPSVVQPKACSIQSLRATITAHMGLLLLDEGKDIDEGHQKLEESLKNYLLTAQDEAKIAYYLAKHYLKTAENLKAQSLLTESYKLSTFSIPTITKPVLSALATLLEKQKSAYLSNMSIGVVLRHQKISLLERLDTQTKQLNASKQNTNMDELETAFARMGLNDDEIRSLFQLQHSSEQEFITKFTERLPDDIAVCSLCLSHDFSKIVLSRLEHKSEPIVVDIQLIKKASEIQDAHKIYNFSTSSKISASLAKLMERATATDGKYWQYQTAESVGEDEQSTLYTVLQEFESIQKASAETLEHREDKQMWWKRRHALDNRMKNLLEYMENVLLGEWKGLLLDTLDEKTLERVAELNKKKEMETSRADNNPPNEQQTMIRSRKGRVTRRRRRPNSTEQQTTQTTSSTHQESKKSKKSKHIVLILDKLLQMLPWESIPSLRQKSVSRMPSLLFVYSHLLQKQKPVDPRKTFFVLNPSGDLKNTQQRFENYFKEKGWQGITGIAPTAEQFKAGLENYDLFIYMGHGSGIKYCSNNILSRLRQCAVTLSIGCSSGKLEENGEYEPYGVVHNYILAGCPCWVGNLWDVTDKDIDVFAQHVLDTWLNPKCDKPISLTSCIPKARDECKMKYLIGSAPVVYGLPVYINQ